MSDGKCYITYMLMNEPILNGTTITLELQRAKKHQRRIFYQVVELIGYLRGKLHNHDIVINVKSMKLLKKYAFTPDDKYD
jgi:hypothetical protein